MKNNKSKIAGSLFLLFVSLISFSCCTTEALSSPYLISNPHIELGEYENAHNFAGMYFSFYNGSDKKIENFTLSFLLYDSDGNNPFVGSNCIVSKCEWPIQSGSSIDFIINLDPYISVVPSEEYQIDYLYVRQITYEDGSVWRDPYGMYCVREAVE